MTQSEIRSINGREISDSYSRNQLLSKIDKNKINDDGTGKDELWSADKVNAQFNTIVQEKYDDISLSGSTLSMSANGTVKKFVTLPTTTEGGSSSNVDINTMINSSSNIQANSYNVKPIRPLISFVDDDGKAGVYTKWKPIVETKGVPISLCIITGSVGGSGYLTWEQIKEMQNTYGCEILSHTVTHKNISGHTTNKSWIDELKQSKLTLMQNGLNVRGFAYPNGGYWGTSEGLVDGTSNGYWMTGLFYDYGITTGGSMNQHPLNTNMGIDRVGIGCYETSGYETLDGMKAKVDECIANNRWLVFMTHVDDTAHTTEDTQNLSSIIDYIKEKGVDIVTLSEGFEVFGNVVETPNCKITKQGSATLNVTSEIPNATKNTAGIVQVGNGISVVDGVISVDNALYYSKTYLDTILDTIQSDIENLKNNQSGGGTDSSPTVSSISPIKTSPGTNFDIVYTALDSDGIQMHELSTDNGVNYNTISPVVGDSNSFIYTTSIADEGVYYCKLKVTDTLGNLTIKSFSVTVESTKILLTGITTEGSCEKIGDDTFLLTDTTDYDNVMLFDQDGLLELNNSYNLCIKTLEKTGEAIIDSGSKWDVIQANGYGLSWNSFVVDETIKKPFTYYSLSDSATNRLIYIQFPKNNTGATLKLKIWIEG